MALVFKCHLFFVKNVVENLHCHEKFLTLHRNTKYDCFLIVPWCNGSTSVSGTACKSSNLFGTTCKSNTKVFDFFCCLFVDFFVSHISNVSGEVSLISQI